MDELKQLFAGVRAVLDTETVRALLYDAWALEQERPGSGVSHARNLLAGVERWQEYHRELKAKYEWPECPAGPAGAVLGVKSLPLGGGDWWALLPDGKVLPGDDRRAGLASHWCRGGEGWWKVPAEERRADLEGTVSGTRRKRLHQGVNDETGGSCNRIF